MYFSKDVLLNHNRKLFQSHISQISEIFTYNYVLTEGLRVIPAKTNNNRNESIRRLRIDYDLIEGLRFNASIIRCIVTPLEQTHAVSGKRC